MHRLFRQILAVLVAVLSCAHCLSAQTTRVRGRVVDLTTGEGVPFASVMFKGTTIGTSASLDGSYSLEAEGAVTDTVCVSMLSYVTREAVVSIGGVSEVDFYIFPCENVLASASVRPDNRKARHLLEMIDANRHRNDPDRRPRYVADIYAKSELDLSHPEDVLRGKRLRQDLAFIFDYIDTSSVAGVPCLPVMISETVVRRNHSLQDGGDWEEVQANSISGVNPENNMLSQFTGSMHIRVNFYKDFIDAFGVQLPSPIQAGGMAYYNYYVVDSLQLDGRRNYVVHFHPRRLVSSPAFDGEMLIDAEDWALRKMTARLRRGSNVNWMRDLAIEAEYERMADAGWFYARDRLFVDFDALLGSRELVYSNPRFDVDVPVRSGAAMVKVDADAGGKDAGYWDDARPIALSDREQGVYEMVDRVQQTQSYETLDAVVRTFANGYLDVGKVGFGPVLKFVSFNPLEGFRPQFGMRTSPAFSTRDRIGGYVAYGFRDGQFKGGLSYEHMFAREPFRKLTARAVYDVCQLGREGDPFFDNNILTYAFSRRGGQKLTPQMELSLRYDHEICSGVEVAAGASVKRLYSNGFVPMATQSGERLGSIAVNELSLSARFSGDETVNRGHFVKRHLFGRYPVLTLDLSGGIGGLRDNDWSYLRPELSLDYKLRLPPAGAMRMHFNCGAVLGQVPYPLLKLHEGNATYLFDSNAFSCMDYFEFASDRWVTLMMDHNFNGWFLGKVPLVRRLNLREVVTLRATYGTLSERNGADAPLVLPYGMKQMEKPYVEVGAGVTNILRMFRVEGFWRLTNGPRFVLNLGADLSF